MISFRFLRNFVPEIPVPYRPLPDYICNADVIDEQETATRENLKFIADQVAKKTDTALNHAERTLALALTLTV